MIQSLRDALLDLLILYVDGPRVIVTQVCIALAALAIPDVVNACATLQHMDAILQFLTVLPEESCDGRRMILTVRRFEIDHNRYRKLNSMIALNCF